MNPSKLNLPILHTTLTVLGVGLSRLPVVIYSGPLVFLEKEVVAPEAITVH